MDGAIHAAAGPELLAQCRALREREYPDGLPVGQAAATQAGDLRVRWVIHTVGPNRHVGETDPALLAACFSNSLRVADELRARTVAFPAVGAGVYGWDAGEAGRIAVDAARTADTQVAEVTFVLFSPRVLTAFEEALAGDA